MPTAATPPREFMTYLKHFKPDVEVVGESWPKLFQPDYTEIFTKILQTKPQALYSCLWGGDLTSFIDQGNIYALFGQTETFAVNMADYTALTAVKNLPKGIHSGNRYIKTFPEHAGECRLGRRLSREVQRISDQLVVGERDRDAVPRRGGEEGELGGRHQARRGAEGLTINSPFGADGKLTMRAEDQTLVGYAIGWGTTIPNEPYVTDIAPGDWNQIFELEAEWKKSKNYT